MENKKKKILFVVLGVLLIILVVWLIFFLKKDETLPPDIYSIESQPIFPVESIVLSPEAPSQEASTEFTVANLAKTYVARFGSWSTDNQGQNLQQLLSLSTQKMQNYINSIELNYDRDDFYGVTSKSISYTLNDLDEENGVAEILVRTQRVETNTALQEKIYAQDVLVNLVLSDDTWLVDQVSWQ